MPYTEALRPWEIILLPIKMADPKEVSRRAEAVRGKEKSDANTSLSGYR